MKRNLLAVTLLSLAVTGNAQVLKSNFMKGYKEGDKLEKSVYTDKADAIAQDTWCGALASTPDPNPSPVVGKELSYEGYAEKGQSIVISGPTDTKGARTSVYSMTNGKQYAKGAYYLSFLVNFSKVGSGKMADFLGVSAAYVGGSNRANIYVAREGKDIRFGTSLLKLKAETTMAYSMDQTHLVIMKLDYANQTVSLYIDPKPDGGEPTEADCEVTGDAENVLKHPIRSVSFRNRSGYNGNVGNFRWSSNWAGVIAQ